MTKPRRWPILMKRFRDGTTKMLIRIIWELGPMIVGNTRFSQAETQRRIGSALAAAQTGLHYMRSAGANVPMEMLEPNNLNLNLDKSGEKKE